MRVFFGSILLVLVVYAAGFLLFLARLPSAPAAPHADGIVALTGGDARLDTAVALLEKGAAKRLLISGVDLDTEKDTLGRMSNGGPRFACCADLGYAAEDTRGNAEEAAEWAREHGFKSLIVVTARYHMPRALQEFSHAMPRASLIAYPVETGSVDVAGWWRHKDTAILLQREYMKYLASLVAHSLNRAA
ncbi:MAG: YdcF family protein [Alphaproteobacteria bacterium]|nr:YdcF family protein [Alphaproteobacteria bacterium]